MTSKLQNYLFQFSAVIVLVSAALYIIAPGFVVYPFAIGAAGVAIARLSERGDEGSLRVKRLIRLRKLATLMLIFASYFMFKPHMQWVPLLLAYAAVELYTSLMIAREQK
jgi:hypothetical protein